MNISNEIEKNYKKWRSLSCQRWNGEGEDVFHNSLLLLYEKMNEKKVNFTSPRALSVWVYKVIKNKGKDVDEGGGQGRKKINKNTIPLQPLQDAGFQPRAKEEKKIEINYEAIWEEPIHPEKPENTGVGGLPLFNFKKVA